MGAVNIHEESKRFALEIIKLYSFLNKEKNEYILAKQLLRSGTSIGANVRESKNAQSQLDFLNKINIALKEADETQYWLELLYESNYISEEQFRSLFNDSKIIVGTLVNIVKSVKENINKNKIWNLKVESWRLNRCAAIQFSIFIIQHNNYE